MKRISNSENENTTIVGTKRITVNNLSHSCSICLSRAILYWWHLPVNMSKNLLNLCAVGGALRAPNESQYLREVLIRRCLVDIAIARIVLLCPLLELVPAAAHSNLAHTRNGSVIRGWVTGCIVGVAEGFLSQLINTVDYVFPTSCLRLALPEFHQWDVNGSLSFISKKLKISSLNGILTTQWSVWCPLRR